MTADEAIDRLKFFSAEDEITVDDLENIIILIQQQEQQIEAMKCCGNCLYWYRWKTDEKCTKTGKDAARNCVCSEWHLSDNYPRIKIEQQVKEGMNKDG